MEMREWVALFGRELGAASRKAGIPEPCILGASDGYGLVWMWRRMDDIPNTVVAGCTFRVGVDVLNEGVECALHANAYDRENRGDAWGRQYWGRFIPFSDLAQSRNEHFTEIGRELGRAWRDIPPAVQRLPEVSRQKQKLLEELRRRGLLYE